MMRELTREEMEQILYAHGKAELEFDVDATMATVVPDPHYEIAHLGLAVDGWDAVLEMYKRLIPGNIGRDIQYLQRLDTASTNTLVSEAYVSFNDSSGERVNGFYVVAVEFDPALKKVVGERIYADAAFGRLYAENLGDDFARLPGVTRLADSKPIIGQQIAVVD